MINNFKPGEYVTEKRYEVRFFVDASGGLAFPCDKDGNVILTNPAAEENYRNALNHPEKYPYYFNKLIEYETSYKEPNTGTCHCGQKMELVNEYMGACECPKCGQWYNIWGQELKNPETWSDGDDW